MLNEMKSYQLTERAQLTENPEFDLLIKLSNYIGLFSFLLKNVCTIQVVHKLDNSMKQIKIDVAKLNNDYSFEKFNQTTIIMQKKFKPNQHDKYLVFISSLVACFLPSISPNLTLKQVLNEVRHLDDEPKIKNENIFEIKNINIYENSTMGFFERPDLQPVFYVSTILGLFTIIFALILMFSYRYNKQDAELFESKLFIKQWTQSYFNSKRKHSSRCSSRKFSAFDTILHQPAKITFTMNKKKSFSSYFKRSNSSFKIGSQMKSSSHRQFQPVSIILQEDTPQSDLAETKIVKFDLKDKRLSDDLASIKTC